jgi:hypothetical protein
MIETKSKRGQTQKPRAKVATKTETTPEPIPETTPEPSQDKESEPMEVETPVNPSRSTTPIPNVHLLYEDDLGDNVEEDFGDDVESAFQ